MSQAYKPLHHKYRPESFDGLIGQEAIAATLKQALITNRIAPAYLFSGPRGTGKTSSARILARSLNCLSSDGPTPEPCGKCDLCKAISQGTSLDVIEIDAASNTGVDNIRELIERSRFAPVQARWKVYVVDECHMLSTAAFNALLKTLEEPPPNVVFVLATTDPQRVLPTILSRCQRFDFHRIRIDALTKHLAMIASLEAIQIEPKALDLIAQKAQGGLRDAESMLDQLSLLPQPVKTDSIWDLLGAVPEQELLLLASALAQRDSITLLDTCRNILNRGRDPIAVLQGLASILRDLVLTNAAPNRPELLSISTEFHEELAEIGKEIDTEKLFQWQAQLKGSESQIRQSMQPHLWLEVLLLGILAEPAIVREVEPKQQQKSSPLPLQTKSIQEKVQQKPENKSVKIDSTLIENVKPDTSNLEVRQNISQDLVEIWQQILGRLELPSTRMLLSQQAKLIKLTPDKAVVQVAGNWIGMVQSRVSLIEQAINQTLDRSIKLILESQDESSDSKFSELKAINPGQALPLQEKAPSTLDNKKDIVQESTLNKKDDINQDKSKSINDSNELKAIDSKAKRLADFFNGEVLDDDI